jgi:NADH:ubiquinone oxidoreductase subunit F (NADH-binding)/(2Fe-2S) ferredoxin/NAD-dependent dihydropyrimidine dehydrogenase PreA subunit
MIQMSHIKLRSGKDIEQLRDNLAAESARFQMRILICMTGCRALGAQDVAEAFRRQLKENSLDHKVAVVEVGCIGLCARAPVVVIEPLEFFYGGVKPEDVDEIIEKTLIGGTAIQRLAWNDNGKTIAKTQDVPFYAKQSRMVLGNCGRIDPMQITQALEQGAYHAAVKTLAECTPEHVIQQVLDSGLRGRGGAGFPSGLKWKFCRQAPGQTKYLICNADEGDPGAFMDRALLEGDPGAFMDRALLEGDPHRVIEGMIIAAYAIGASRAFIYVRAEYPIAVKHINIAIEQARNAGLLGKDIAASGFDLDIDVRIGAGAFVCGEETALIASLQGRRGMPKPRPPFPAQQGYLDRPTNINNVETFANVPIIMRNGAQRFSSIGTEKSKGTKIFALAGDITNTGLVEVPMGTTLREIVYDIGGGIIAGNAFKAAQLGGPSGGCIPATYLDTEIDYDNVQAVGAIMGSGGLIVMDEKTCMVDVARYFLEFVQAESCGKCTPCRVGTKKMLNMLKAICAGDASVEDLDKLKCLGEDVRRASLCGLGQTAPNPVLSTLRHFRDEYVEHIRDRRCRAGVCKDLLRYEIVQACVGCGACIRACSVDAITGVKKEKHAIDQGKCIKCGQCYDACKFQAITR